MACEKFLLLSQFEFILQLHNSLNLGELSIKFLLLGQLICRNNCTWVWLKALATLRLLGALFSDGPVF